MSGRLLITLVAVVLNFPQSSAAQSAEDPPREQIAERMVRGERFLTNLFKPERKLLPEFRGSKAYWLFHDNYLAAKILVANYPWIAKDIRSALARYSVTNSGKIEILFNEAAQPLPFRAYVLTNIAVVNGNTIRTEMVAPQILKGWEEYADLLLLGSMALATGAPGDARRNFDRAAAMWDGHGLADRATQKNALYATYKLGLYLIAADRLKISPAQAREVRSRLLVLQNAEGGWVTDYDKDGRPIGFANVETTCIALLALRAAAAR